MPFASLGPLVYEENWFANGLASIPRDVTEAPPPRDPVFLIQSVCQNRRDSKKRVHASSEQHTLLGYQSSLRSVAIYELERETVFSLDLFLIPV